MEKIPSRLVFSLTILAGAFAVSLLIFTQVYTKSKEDVDDEALLKRFALTPVYSDERGVGPMYGTIKVEFVVTGTVTKDEEFTKTTTTYKANASWTILYDKGGISETKTVSGTKDEITVDKRDGKTATSKTTYSLHPSQAVTMRTYGSKGAGELSVIASEKKKSCWFYVRDEQGFKVTSQVAGKDWDGQTYTHDYETVWFIWSQIPSRWRGLEECLAAGKHCPPGTVEGSFSDGKTSGSYSAPVLFKEGLAYWEPTLRILGIDVDDLVRGTMTITWNLGGKPEGLEVAIIPPDRYQDWMPEGGKDEGTAGNDLLVKVRLQSVEKKDKDTQQKAKFTFELVDVSTEPGVCMNWPTKGNGGSPFFDLKIDKKKGLEVKDDKGQWARTEKYHDEFEIIIKSYDWGGWGRLKVTAETEGGKKIENVYVEGHKGMKELQIPWDLNNNHIADKYERDFHIPGNKAADSDEDFIPEGDGNRGDGLTLYEEYRGFMTRGNKHVRSDPARKTLFIYNKVPHGKAGIDLFKAQSRIEVFELDKEQQMNPSRVINYNNHHAHKTDQHGLKMNEALLETGTTGMTQLGPPKKVDAVQIQKDYEKVYGNDKAVTIAHELGHAVRMQHHGDGNYDCADRGYCVNEFERRREEECSYVPSCVRKYRGALTFYIAVQGGENSGDENCIMRYNEAHYYEKGWENKTFHLYGRDRKPTQFCSSKGTNEKTGQATRGNCMGQICVSDKYH